MRPKQYHSEQLWPAPDGSFSRLQTADLRGTLMDRVDLTLPTLGACMYKRLRLFSATIFLLGFCLQAFAAPRVPTPLKVFRQPVFSTLEGRFGSLGSDAKPAQFIISKKLRGNFVEEEAAILLSESERARVVTNIDYLVVIRHANVDPQKPLRLIPQNPASLVQTDGAVPALFFVDASKRDWFLDTHELRETSAGYGSQLLNASRAEKSAQWMDLINAELINAQQLREELSPKEILELASTVSNPLLRAGTRSRVFNALSSREIVIPAALVDDLASKIICQEHSISNDLIRNTDELIFNALTHFNRKLKTTKAVDSHCLIRFIQNTNANIAELSAKLLLRMHPKVAAIAVPKLLADPLLPRETRIVLVSAARAMTNPAQ
jgi:hypothetical protein